MVEREEGGGKYFPVLSQLLIKNRPPVVAVGEKVADSGREEWWGEWEESVWRVRETVGKLHQGVAQSLRRTDAHDPTTISINIVRYDAKAKISTLCGV